MPYKRKKQPHPSVRMNIAAKIHRGAVHIRFQTIFKNALYSIRNVLVTISMRRIIEPHFRRHVHRLPANIERQQNYRSLTHRPATLHFAMAHQTSPARRRAQVCDECKYLFPRLLKVLLVTKGAHQSLSSNSKMSSTFCAKARAIFMASGSPGSYLPVSIALIACRVTPTRMPSSACDQFCSALSTRKRFFMIGSTRTSHTLQRTM